MTDLNTFVMNAQVNFMGFERFGNTYSNVMNLAGLVFCLFRYVTKPRRAWIYAIAFLLCCLLSNYYWGVYVLVMDGEYPSTSSILAYFGWNAAFLILPMLQVHMMSAEERGFFSPLCLLPIPLNIAQFILYLQFGGLFNNIWQGLFATVSACLALNSIIYHLREKRKTHDAAFPYVPLVSLAFIFLEYVMWTSSCFDWPSEWLYPYNYAAILDATIYVILPVAIFRTFGDKGRFSDNPATARLQKSFGPVYIGLVTFFGLGGYFLALWMRGRITAGIGEVGDSDPYSVIAVMLFGVSFMIVLFSVTTILVVNTLHKVAESEELRAAKTVAEQSNAAKSDFLANMSHEIRTPINAVLGMNEMIMRESLKARDGSPDDRGEIRKVFSDICTYSGNIASAGNSLLSLINDILDFSKIEAGKLEIIPASYKLGSVLNDVSNMIVFKARSKGLEFDVDVDETLPDGLYGDELRIRQILTNLLNNAVKYTHNGSVKLAVRYKDHPSDDGERVADIIFSVRDTGVGIKAEDVDKLFTKFERIDLAHNSTVEGTGLGLAITKSLLDQMNGKIKVDSTYGSGTIFTVTIPQKILADEPVGDFREHFKQSIESLEAGKDLIYCPDASILIVDDTNINLLVAKGLLKNTGIKIDTATGGEEAIALARENRYDLILMDQRMPGMDGVTSMNHIKEDEKGLNRKTPFICLTADAVSGAKEKYIAEGFDGYLSKPIEGQALEKALAKYLIIPD